MIFVYQTLPSLCHSMQSGWYNTERNNWDFLPISKCLKTNIYSLTWDYVVTELKALSVNKTNDQQNHLSDILPTSMVLFRLYIGSTYIFVVEFIIL